jgi:hypothetical protein
MKKSILKKITSSVIRVGEGRGFIVADKQDNRLIVTAAHCLPSFPPCHGMSNLEERTYAALLARLGDKPTVWTECLFADPIADIAVLGSPDNQALWEEAEAYDAMLESAAPSPIVDAPEDGFAWLLSLEGQWFSCFVKYINNGSLWISKTAQPIMGGMSGSPVISSDGSAIGVVALSSNPRGLSPEIADRCEGEIGCKNPRLVRDLPGWLVPQTQK